MKRDPELFIVATGVSGNLGDAVIRRRVLRWFETDAPRRVYVGKTTDDWVEQLQLPSEDRVYRAAERTAWLKSLIFGRGPRVLVFDPGEVPLGKEHAKSELIFLLICLWLRLRGAYIVRPPRAVAHYSRVTGTLHRLGCRVSQTVMWRDASTAEKMRCGDLTPDTAFGEERSDVVTGGPRRLGISLRGARPAPTAEWITAVTRFASQRSLVLTPLTQVDEDEARTAEVADLLRAEGAQVDHIPWGDDLSDLEREDTVRNLYSECDLVISDRLHVLLLAAKAGAVPTEVVETPAPKVRTHFATAGIEEVSFDSARASIDDIERFLVAASGRTTEVAEKVDAAERSLNDYVDRIPVRG